MNAILLILSFCVANIAAKDSCKEKYTEYILKRGFRFHSYYLNVCIEDKQGKKFDVAVTSYELYQILKEESSLDEAGYINLLKTSILEKKPVKLAKPFKDYVENTFLPYREDKRVNEIAKQGKEYFIKYFLGESDPAIPIEKEQVNPAAIIKQLIDWNIPVRLDDEGAFFAETAYFKCTSE